MCANVGIVYLATRYNCFAKMINFIEEINLEFMESIVSSLGKRFP